MYTRYTPSEQRQSSARSHTLCMVYKRSNLVFFFCLLINDVQTEAMPVEELFALFCLAKE